MKTTIEKPELTEASFRERNYSARVASDQAFLLDDDTATEVLDEILRYARVLDVVSFTHSPLIRRIKAHRQATIGSTRDLKKEQSND